MNISNKYLLLIAIIIFSCSLYGQKKWNLERCIEYSFLNNNSIQISTLNIELIETKNKYQKHYLIPTLNGGVSHGYNWGQSIDPFTNQFATNKVRTNTLYLSSSYNLFSGLQNYYSQKKSIVEIQYQQYNREVEKQNLKINITANYLQVILNYQNYHIALEQVNLTLRQVERILNLISEEQLTSIDKLEVEAQLSLDSLSLIKSENKYKYSLITLKNLINIPNSEYFEIELNQSLNDSTLNIYIVDLGGLPQIKIYDKKIDLEHYNMKIAQSGYYPSLSLSGSIGSGYSGNNIDLINGEVKIKPFNEQLDKNFYQTVSLSLNIPILNSGITKSSIELSKIEIEKSILERQQAIVESKSLIEKLKIDIINAQAEKSASEKAYKSISKIMEVTALKYEEGEINFATYLEIRNKLFMAKTEQKNSEINLLFKQKILGYYL